MDEKTIVLFDDYLQGALSPEDKKSFELRLENDTELQDAFAIFKDLNGHLSHTFSKERGDFKASLEQASTQYFDKETASKKEVKVIRFKPMRYLVAACVVMLFGTIFWFQMQEATYSDYSFKGSIDLIERGGVEDAFAKAEKAFNNASYEESIPYFEAILENDPANAQVLYYKGIALVENAQYTEAESVFLKLSKGSSVFKYEAQWYLGLSYLKQEDKTRCKALLVTIPQEASIYKRAQELLKKLD